MLPLCAWRAHAPVTAVVTSVSGSRVKVRYDRCCSDFSGNAHLRQVEPAQCFEVVSHPRRNVTGRLGTLTGKPVRICEVLFEHRLLRAHLVLRIAHVAGAGVVADVGKAKWWFDRPGAVMPQSRHRVEPVVRQETRTETRDEQHGIDDVVSNLLVEEVREVHANPAGLDAFAPLGYLPLERMRALDVDAEQSMSVRTCARAAAARLDP